MACLERLKQDICFIKKLFPLSHRFISITGTSLDLIRINLHFIDDVPFEVQCNILDNYPRAPSIWYTEYDDPVVCSLLNNLTEATDNFTILFQLNYLVTQYCTLKNLEIPIEFSYFSFSSTSFEEMMKDQGDENNVENKELNDLDSEDELNFQDDKNFQIPDNEKFEYCEINKKEKELLYRLQLKERENRAMNRHIVGTRIATDRLMKELEYIYNSSSYKNGIFSIELENNNLYRWTIILKKVDLNSPLPEDLKKFKNEGNNEGIVLKAIFGINFPMAPPSIYLHPPELMDKYFTPDEDLFIKLFADDTWSPAYNMESVILQIPFSLTNLNYKNISYNLF